MEKLIVRNGAEVGVQDALSDLLPMSLVRRLGLIPVSYTHLSAHLSSRSLIRI